MNQLNDEYIKTKIGLYDMNFYGNKMSIENERYACLSVTLLDPIFVNSNEEYYPQVFLKEYKYAVKNNKIMNISTKN